MNSGSAVEEVEVEVGVGGSVVLRVEVSGSGVPLIMLHGFTGDASTMSCLSQRLSDRHLVAVPDLVGHGRSSVPEPTLDYEVGSMARHVAAVADTLGLDRFHLVGYSMGGRVALTLACTTPDRVSSLSLIGASAGIADADMRAQRRVADEALADRIEADGLEAFVDGWMAKPLFASQASLGPEYLAEARRQRLANDPSGLAGSLRGGGTGVMTPLHDSLGGCMVPTLLLVGANDGKFRVIADELRILLPDAVCSIVPGAGHAAHLENPDAVVAAISGHVAAVDQR